MIDKFRGKYYFLSNFYNSPVTYLGLTYLNNEAAFHAQKTNNHFDKISFTCLNPSDAKKLGRRINLRADWEEVKRDIMFDICLAKFSQNENLKNILLETGNEYLEEGNTWGDKYWGVCEGEGLNHLGKILMEVREILRERSKNV